MKAFWRRAAEGLIAAAAICSLTVGAAAGNEARIQDCVPEERTVRVFLSGTGGETPEKERFSASLGGVMTEITELATAEAQPVIWYCLTDASGSLSQDRLAREKEVLLAVSSRISREDRMVITYPGNETPPEYLWDRDALTAKIRALDTGRESADLYGAVIRALEELSGSGDQTAALRKCLVVLTNIWKDGSTSLEDVERAITRYRIPVYTVSLIEPSAMEDGRGAECAGILETMAERSPGGGSYRPVGTDGAAAGTAMAADMRGDLILTLDLSPLDWDLLSRRNLGLAIHYDTGEAVLTDSMEVDGEKLTAHWPEEETTKDPVEPPRQGESRLWMVVVIVLLLAAVLLLLPIPSRKKGGSRQSGNRRRDDRGGRREADRGRGERDVNRRRPTRETGEASPGHRPPTGSGAGTGGRTRTGSGTENRSRTGSGVGTEHRSRMNGSPSGRPDARPSGLESGYGSEGTGLSDLAGFSGDFSADDEFTLDFAKEFSRSFPVNPPLHAASVRDPGNRDKPSAAVGNWQIPEGGHRQGSMENGRPVTFTALGPERMRFVLRIPEERTVTLGRNHSADLVLNPEDRKLSGVHCRVRLIGNALRVWDAGSTNGTAVNGVPVPIGSSALAEDGQTLKAGSYEYRIHIQ